MTELEKYIRSNAAEFDCKEPAEGHQERFMAKLDAVSDKPSRNIRRIVFGTIAAAATLAGVFFAGRAVFAPKDPAAIYLAYMEEVSRLYRDCPMENSDVWDDAIAQLTEEAVPLFEQLPDEMSRREKARILRNYYGTLLDGARQLANQ